MTNYVTNKTSGNHVLYSIGDYVSCARLSICYQAYLSVFSSIVEPKSFQEASKDRRCVEAMQEEIQAL